MGVKVSREGPRDYIGYVRVSQVRGRDSDETKDRFHSPEMQLDRIKASVERVQGTYVDIKTDLDRSGYQKNVIREGWDEAVAWVMEDPTHRGIVAYDTSRLSRNLWKLLGDIQHTLVPAGARVLVAGEGIDTAQINWEMQLQMTGMIAENFSRKMGERWDQVHARRIAKNQHPIGRVPYGYTKIDAFDPKTGSALGVEPDPETAPVVRRVFQLYLDGQGIRAIAQILNSDSIATARGNPWSTTTIGRLLDDPASIGKYEFKGEVIEGGWDSIIDADTWERVKTMRAKRKTVPNRSKSSGWTLAGIARCAYCGGKLTVNYLPQVVEDGDEDIMVKMPKSLAGRADKPDEAQWSIAEKKLHRNAVSTAMCTTYRSMGKEGLTVPAHTTKTGKEKPEVKHKGCQGVFMRRVTLETQFTYFLATMQEQVANATTGQAGEQREAVRNDAVARVNEAKADIEKASDARANLALMRASGDINEAQFRQNLRILKEREDDAVARLEAAESIRDAAEPLSDVWDKLATGGAGMAPEAWNLVLKRAVQRVEVSDDTLLFVPTLGEPVEWDRQSLPRGRDKRRVTITADRKARLARAKSVSQPHMPA